MKNWLPNSVLLSWLLVSGAAYADSLDDAHKCLTEANLPCAVEIQQKLLAEQPNNTDVLQLTARTLFHQGEFEEVVAIFIHSLLINCSSPHFPSRRNKRPNRA